MDEAELRIRVTQADLELKTKQAFWETPRNLVIVIGTLLAATAALSGFLGYKAGQTPTQPVQVIFQPGSIVASPVTK